MRRLIGIGVSPGVASGRAVILGQRGRILRYHLPPERIDRELARLEHARNRTGEQLREIRDGVSHRRGPELAAIFDAQLLMLNDPMLLPQAARLIRTEQVNAEWALHEVYREFGQIFDEIPDPYLRERKGDLADLVGRLRMNIRQGEPALRDLLHDVDDASVLIADELTPSVAAQVDWTRIRAFATDIGSRTYHTAILARSLDVPAVVGLHDASRLILPGQLVVIDGSDSTVILDPGQEELARAGCSGIKTPALPATLRAHAKPAATADGVRIRLEANIEFPEDLEGARFAGAEGIGLYRSEFLLSGDQAALQEEAQAEVYRRMLEEMAPAPVTVRTFDVDEEQLARRDVSSRVGTGWTDGGRTTRQGLRGLRLSLARPELFRTQLLALLRAAPHGNLRVMFPFVSGVEQLRAARAVLDEAAAELRRRGIAVPAVKVGVMIEIPAAAYTADLLAREVDFFTIGTNDLIQYCLAVDRADERLSGLYEPLHPSILRVLVMIRRAASRRRIPVSLCGEMAADPALLTLLVGLGLREFSMTPGAIVAVKRVLAELREDELRALARRVLRLATVEDIERELGATLERFAV
jgi:phosphotransferase system enzyme I (PtsI)